MNQSKKQMEDEKDFTSALITALNLLGYIPTREQVEEKAKQLSDVFNYEGPLRIPVQEALYSVDSKMGLGVSLIDTNADHDEDWIRREGIKWFYSEAYERFLKSEKWPPMVVQSLSDVGEKILGHLQDPTSEGRWDRRGLVIGHVQSGKTANYIGLTTKAADAGYKFIIVIAGIHNNLRKQTQERVDAGFIGRSSDIESRKIIGVGLGCREYPHPATLTTIYKDFNKQTAIQSGWRINDFTRPIILVIKKNVSTLTSLHKWLKELNATGNGQISDVPMLMIDDEADHASINTNKEDLDPTRTNRMIREILSLFDKSCYVGYTATPFANIFINPEAYDDEVREELFPRDFIYCLDAPNTYVGPDKFFLEDESSEKFLEVIQDAENYISFSHKKGDDISDLPPSLYRAIRQFVIVKAIRNLREQQNRHCSMMVNVSRFVDIQNTVRIYVNVYLKKLKEAIKANYAMPEEVSARNKHMKLIKDVFDKNFHECNSDWSAIKSELFKSVNSIRTFVVNSKSDEALDYKKYEKDGTGLTAIAVGGLSLSRGLTIEGLCISYMYRNTRMYDTLMQMGRWFGYRPGYEDLCRVHLSNDSIDWYAHIAQSADDLREQIKLMRRDGLSPKRFGLYVQSHPDGLLITAGNKMRAGEKVDVEQNFSGRLLESYILSDDEKMISANRQLISKYWKSGFGRGSKFVKQTDKGWIIKNVAIDEIENFLYSFCSPPEFTERKNAAVGYLKAIEDKFPVADVLLISMKDNENREKYQLGAQLRKSASKPGNLWRLSKDRVASRGDEKIGLSDIQIEEAKNLAKESDSDKSPSDFHYRSIRKKPLLMIHTLNLGPEKKRRENVPAFGVSFPTGEYSKAVSVVANLVWVNQLHGGISDSSDEEEDFDE